MDNKNQINLEQICLNQFIRPKIHIEIPGVGNCVTCSPSKENKKCLQYYPITINYYEVTNELDRNI